MKTTSASQSYHSVKNMINKAAHTYSKSFGLPFEDMQAEGNYLFAKAANKYKSHQTKATFSTFLHTVLHNGLITYGCQQTGKNIFLDNVTNDEYDLLESVSDGKANREFAMIDFFQSLADDEKELVNLVLMGFAYTIGGLKKLAMKRLNFREDQFNNAVLEIKKMLREMPA